MTIWIVRKHRMYHYGIGGNYRGMEFTIVSTHATKKPASAAAKAKNARSTYAYTVGKVTLKETDQ